MEKTLPKTFIISKEGQEEWTEWQKAAQDVADWPSGVNRERLKKMWDDKYGEHHGRNKGEKDASIQ